MLLPSALPCETARPRFQSALFSSPPPSPGLPASTSTSLNNLYSTCRALQSMLSPPPLRPTQLATPPLMHTPLPGAFKLRLRARQNEGSGPSTPRMKIMKKRASPPRGGNKRRRAEAEARDVDAFDEAHMEVGEASWCAGVGVGVGVGADARRDLEMSDVAPSTPKRQRRCPPSLPLGLLPSDFDALAHNEREAATFPAEAPAPPFDFDFGPPLYAPQQTVGDQRSASSRSRSSSTRPSIFTNPYPYPSLDTSPANSFTDFSVNPNINTNTDSDSHIITSDALSQSNSHPTYHDNTSDPFIFPSSPSADADTAATGDADSAQWTEADDRALVEMLVGKLKLSQSEWEDCARSLGKAGGVMERRWRSLLVGGQVGLQGGSGNARARIHGTWR